METTNIIREIASLPPEAQKQVIDFIALLKVRYPAAKSVGKMQRVKLSDEPFIGMWQDREDMKDSATWVRHLRESEWERSL